MMNKSFFIIFLFFFLSCKKEDDNSVDIEQQDTFLVYDYTVTNLDYEPAFRSDTTKGGRIEIPALVEASGLAVSRANPNILWSHNDKGHANRLYCLGSKGENFGVFLLNGAGSRDWEDICIGPGPDDNIDYIYVGDIGDNDGVYPYLVIYRFPEPDLLQLDSGKLQQIDQNTVERFEFEYPDGPRDSETLMIDPWTKDIYIVSKRDYRSVIYRAKYPQSPVERTKLEKLAQLPFNWAVAGDISADGTQIAIKDRTTIYYWKREQGETVINALKRKPTRLPYILEPQGESFAWTNDGNGYFTLSEQSGRISPDLYYYSK